MHSEGFGIVLRVHGTAHHWLYQHPLSGPCHCQPMELVSEHQLRLAKAPRLLSVEKYLIFQAQLLTSSQLCMLQHLLNEHVKIIPYNV
jgi:hypothetical protein